ncbi:hypothetical protein [Sinomicrobium sp. M5D2P17]
MKKEKWCPLAWKPDFLVVNIPRTEASLQIKETHGHPISFNSSLFVDKTIGGFNTF